MSKDEMKESRKRERSLNGGESKSHDSNEEEEEEEEVMIVVKKDRKEYQNVVLNHDELASFCLRSVLSSYQFSVLWSVMSDLNWKWSSGRYYSPDGEGFSTSKELCAQLDFFAIPSNNNNFRNISLAETKSRQIGQAIIQQQQNSTMYRRFKLRNDILEALLKKQKFKSGHYQLKQHDDNDDDDDDAKKKLLFALNDKSFLNEWKEPDTFKTDEEIITTATINNYDDNFISATSIEPGAEQYLERTSYYKTRKRKGTTQNKNEQTNNKNNNSGKVQHNNNNNEKTILIQSSNKLEWKKPKQCVHQVKKIYANHDEESKIHYETKELKLRNQFSDWKFQLSTNHSILLYGFGSKETLLNDFSDQQLKNDGQVLTLNGYDLEISIEQILDIIIQSFIDKKHQKKFQGKSNNFSTKLFTTSTIYNDMNSLTPDIIQKSVAISRHLAESHPNPIYIVIHNIDGLKLQNSIAQKCLASLVVNSNLKDDSSRVIRLIASVDHVNCAALLWDTETNAKFSWVSTDARSFTFLYYIIVNVYVMSENDFNLSSYEIYNIIYI